jgi:hypothetical protein
MKQLLCTIFVLLALPFALAEGKDKAEEKEAKPKGSFKSLQELLGKKFKSKEVQAFLKTLPGKIEVAKFQECYFHSSRDGGISLRFDTKDVLTTIFLYAEGAEQFKQYSGELPNGLTFALTRAEIEKKLGKPDKSGGAGVIEYWVSYPMLGIGVTYRSKSTTDLNNKIRHISVSPPKKK